MRGFKTLFRGTVIDTVEFTNTGKIKVQIDGINPDNTYTEAEVMTPFGGLPNMGMQALPPIGAKGFVLFERGDDNYCVWMGAVMATWGEEFDEGYGNPVEAEKPEDFVIKTQYTKLDEQTLDGEENKVENIIKMNANEIILAKVAQGDEYQYNTEAYDSEEQAINLMKLTDEEIKLKYKFADNSKSNSITLKEGSVDMSFDTDAGEMKASVSEEVIELIAGGTTISVSKDGDCEIKVADGKKVKLNGDSGTATLYEGFQNFVNNVFMTHQHASPCGGTVSIIAQANISDAKSKSVKLT